MPYLRIPSYLKPYLIRISHVWWLRSLVIFIHILPSELDRMMGKLAGKLFFCGGKKHGFLYIPVIKHGKGKSPFVDKFPIRLH